MKNINEEMYEKMKNEALDRMKLMGFAKSVIQHFKRTEEPFVSDPPFGGLFDLTEEQKKIVDEFEKNNNALVYQVIRNFTEFGELLSLLYVGKDLEEWEMDRADLKIGYAFSYVVNLTYPECSEFGSICYKTVAGSIIRIG